MKRYFFFASIALAITVQSCDYVEVPQQGTTGGGGGPDSEQVVRKVLIEDYTGHTCGNCPEAASAVQQIKGIYGEKVVAVAVHAGFFADPSVAPYTDDFRTAAGTAYDNFFGISAVGNPNGMVNRIGYPTSTHVKAYSSWSTIADTMLAKDPDINIKITNTYDNNTKQLSANVETKFLTNMSSTYKLVVLLTEDSIIAPQKNYSATPSDILNYVHRHMLRDAVNSAWGDTVSTGTVNAGILVTKNFVYNGIASHTNWNPDHCYVVAYVYDAATYEVIQAEEKKVK